MNTKTNTRTKTSTKRLAAAAMLIAVGVIGGAWSIPVGAAKCAPVQHMINILAASILPPGYGVAMAAIISTLRIGIGTGTFLAYPGSMAGALLSGLLCYAAKKSKKSSPLLITASAAFGELFGTAVIGGMLAYPVAVFFMGKEAALYTYILPFFISTLGGTVIGVILYNALRKTRAIDFLDI